MRFTRAFRVYFPRRWKTVAAIQQGCFDSAIFIRVCFHRDRLLKINSNLIEAFSAAVR
jgi:hypothetical protein